VSHHIKGEKPAKKAAPAAKPKAAPAKKKK
jgi:hypothetical protein